MLLVEPLAKSFTTKEIADTTQSREAILALAVDSRERVDELVDRALEAGGRPMNDPDDKGNMCVRSFGDPDGHHWEAFYLEPAPEQE